METIWLARDTQSPLFGLRRNKKNHPRGAHGWLGVRGLAGWTHCVSGLGGSLKGHESYLNYGGTLDKSSSLLGLEVYFSWWHLSRKLLPLRAGMGQAVGEGPAVLNRWLMLIQKTAPLSIFPGWGQFCRMLPGSRSPTRESSSPTGTTPVLSFSSLPYSCFSHSSSPGSTLPINNLNKQLHIRLLLANPT